MGYELADGVSLECADGTYVFLKGDGDAAVPNYVGGVIVERLLENGLRSCLDYVLESYDAGPGEAERDLEEFVAELERHGLVREVDG